MNAHLAPDSPLMYELVSSLNSLDKAARAMERLAVTLEQQPSAIISGRKALDR